MKAKSLQRLVTLAQTARKLQQHVEHLEQQQLELRVQEHVLDTLCELLGWLREGIKVHPAWLGCTESWLPQELALLQQLGMPCENAPSAPCSHHQQQQLGTLLPTPAASGQPSQQAQQRRDEQQQDDLQVLLSLLVDQACDPAGQWQQAQLLAQLQAIQGSPSPQHKRSCLDVATAAQLGREPHNDAQQTAGAGSTPAAGVSRGSSMAAAAAAAAAAPGCLVPDAVFLTDAGDYLGGFRCSLSQEPDATLQAMNLESFLVYYKPMIKEMALLVSLAEQQGRGKDLADGMQHPLLMLQGIQLRHLHRINTILLLHPDDLLHRLRVVNVNTLELSDTPEQSWDRMCWVADNLGLSQKQEATLVAGSQLFSRLVDRVRAERQALSAQQGVQAEQRLATGRALDLEGQEVSAQRLSVLVKKERFLLTCASMFTAGVLNVVQNAKTAILSWPYIPDIGLLGSVLLARARAAQAPHPTKAGKQRSSKAQGSNKGKAISLAAVKC